MKLHTFFLLLLAVSQALAANPLEIRAVADAAGDGITEHSLNHSDGRTEKVLLHREILLGHNAVRTAKVVHGEGRTQPEILITLTEVGAKQFGAVSEKYLNKRIGILLDGRLYSAPRVAMPIPGGKIMVSGNFTEAEAAEFVIKLRFSSAPLVR